MAQNKINVFRMQLPNDAIKKIGRSTTIDSIDANQLQSKRVSLILCM